jgi:hypothetical protein
MNIIYKHIEGSQSERPLEVDTISSKSVVYLRKNIERVEKEDEQGIKYEVWSYDEAQLTPDEYSIFLQEDTQSKVEYLIMMLDL